MISPYEGSDGSRKGSLRVAVIVNRFPTASETFVFNKVVGLAEAGFQVTVISHDHSDDFPLYHHRIELSLIRCRCLRGFMGILRGLVDFCQLVLHEPRLAWRLIAIAMRGLRKGGASRVAILGALAARQCDIVHFELSGLGVAYLPVLSLLRPAKLFVSCRGSAEQIKPLADLSRGPELSKLFRLVDRVHCVSQDMLDTCRKFGLNDQNSFINRPAIRVEVFTRVPSLVEKRMPVGPIRICSTGRLHWKKGLEFALLAIKLLKDSGDDVYYEIIGDGPEREKLVYMINYLELSDSVMLYGKQDSSQVRARLEINHIFLLPSLSEGISNSVLEAMAMELPVISTRSGGMDEVIVHEHNGLLVDCCAPEQIANSIRRLSGDINFQCQLGRRARETILDQFTIERQIKKFVIEYRMTESGPWHAV